MRRFVRTHTPRISAIVVLIVAVCIISVRLTALARGTLPLTTLDPSLGFVRATIEHRDSDTAFRWVGDHYPISMLQPSAMVVYHLTGWFAPSVTHAQLHWDTYTVPLDASAFQQPRRIAVLVVHSHWWPTQTLTITATPTSRDPHDAIAIAYTQLTWQSLSGTWHPGLVIPFILLSAVWVVVALRYAQMWPWLLAIGSAGMWFVPHSSIPLLWLCALTSLALAVYVCVPAPRWRTHIPPWAWLSITAWCGIVSLVRMAQWPHDFAEAHWLLSYQRLGFVKRALIGSILPTAFTNAAGIALLASLCLLGFLGLLFTLVWRWGQRQHYSVVSFLVACIIMTSPFVVLSGYLNGHFDNIIISIALIMAWWLRRMPQVWWIAPLGVIAVLIHETALLFIVTICGVPWLIRLSTHPDQWRHHARQASVALVPPMATFAVLAWSMSTLDPLVLHQHIVQTLRAHAFVSDDSTYDVITKVADWTSMSFVAHAQKYAPLFWAHLTSRETLSTVPTLLVLWVVAQRTLRHWHHTILVVLASLTPIALHAIAVDTGRISSYMIIIAVALICPQSRILSMPAWWGWGGCLVVLGTNLVIPNQWLVPYAPPGLSLDTVLLWSMPMIAACGIVVWERLLPTYNRQINP